MTITTKSDEVGETIGAFPVAIEFAEWYSMMSVQDAVSTRDVTADLTSVFVSSLGSAGLSFPVGSVCIGVQCATLPQRISFACHLRGYRVVLALVGAKSTVAPVLDHAFVDLVGLATLFTIQGYDVPPPSEFWFGERGDAPVVAFEGTALPIPVGPPLKLLATDHACVDRSFGGICSHFEFAGIRAESLIFPTGDGLEGLAAEFTDADHLDISDMSAPKDTIGAHHSEAGVCRRLIGSPKPSLIVLQDRGFVNSCCDGGFRCDCHLDDTDARVTPGPFPKGALCE